LLANFVAPQGFSPGVAGATLLGIGSITRNNHHLSNSSSADEDRSVIAPSEELGKNISRTTNRLAFAAMATAGLMWPVLVLSPTATADTAPSPGVPCLDLVQAAPPPPPPAPVAAPSPADVVAMAAPAQPPPVAVAAVPLAGGVPPVTVPVAPIAEAVPGFPLLPSSLPVPHDFVCEGTAWSAGRNPGGNASPQTPLAGNRRGEW
jgi:hypothetical protein